MKYERDLIIWLMETNKRQQMRFIGKCLKETLSPGQGKKQEGREKFFKLLGLVMMCIVVVLLIVYLITSHPITPAAIPIVPVINGFSHHLFLVTT